MKHIIHHALETFAIIFSAGLLLTAITVPVPSPSVPSTAAAASKTLAPAPAGQDASRPDGADSFNEDINAKFDGGGIPQSEVDSFTAPQSTAPASQPAPSRPPVSPVANAYLPIHRQSCGPNGCAPASSQFLRRGFLFRRR